MFAVSPKGKKKIFCCSLCNARWHSRKNYHARYKYDSDCKKERREYFRKWRKKNIKYFRHLSILGYHRARAKEKGIPFETYAKMKNIKTEYPRKRYG
jgi:hypothetical protein